MNAQEAIKQHMAAAGTPEEEFIRLIGDDIRAWELLSGSSRPTLIEATVLAAFFKTSLKDFITPDQAMAETSSQRTHQRVPTALPWARALPADALHQCLVDIVNEVMGENGVRTAAMETLLAQWRSTALVYADPETLEVLTSPRSGDYGPVAPPQ